MSKVFKTALISRRSIAKDTLEVIVRRPKDFEYKAGQYIQLGIPELLYPDYKGVSRVLSIASSPDDKEKIAIAFRETGSGFKLTLKNLPLKSDLLLDGPHGFYTLTKKSPRDLVLVSGGIGITPHLSMIRFATKRKIPITLFYSNRNRKSAAYLKELYSLSQKCEYFKFYTKFSRLDKEFVQRRIKTIVDFDWHICGPPGMVASSKELLNQFGINPENIFSEDFVGY